jgi:hypothetical protein
VSVGTTFDLTSITFDAEVPTWDAGLFAGFAQFELDDGTIISLEFVNTRTSGITFDRSMFRAPFGTTWFQSGDARRSPELFTVEVTVVDDALGISSAAPVANALIDVAPRVVRVESNIGVFFVLGLLSVSRSPVESGYRLAFEFGSLDGLRV